MRAALIASLAVMLLVQDALAQAGPSDSVNAMVGAWEFSNAERDKTCVVTFKLDAAAGNYALDLAKNCGTTFPTIKDAAQWNRGKDDQLSFLDGKGKLLLAMDEVESGLFESARGSDALYFLQAVAALEGRERTPDQMFGDWAFARSNGKPICQISLVGEAADTSGFVITLKPGCDALITNFSPKLWRMDHGQLVIVSTGGNIWRLEESDPTTWRRIPEGRQPLLMVKQ
jgi:Protease inhibitor Inh